MRKAVALSLLAALVAGGPVAARAGDKAQPSSGDTSKMPDAMRDLFDRWERVWEGEYDLIPSCVGTTYTRHDQKGDRTVTRDEYAAEIKTMREERPGIRIVVYDHDFKGDRAWFRFAFKWKDPKSGAPQSIAGMQSYRIAGGKLVETWLIVRPLGSAWSDETAQKTWTSPPPIE